MTVRVMAQQSGVTAEDHRLAISVGMGGGASGQLNKRSGVVPYVGACDLTSVSAMVAAISPFQAWVDGTSNSLQGGYPVTVDAAVNITFDNGEGGNSRTDRVILQIRHDTYDSSGSTDGRVVYLKGQAGGAANPLPASSLLLWEVTVPAGASAGGGGINFSTQRVDTRTYASALGAPVIVAGATERDTLTAYEGLEVWRVDAKAPQVYTASAWRWVGILVTSGSSNRDTLVPSGVRYTGQTIFRTDTGLHETWDGASWLVNTNPIARLSHSTTQSIADSTDVAVAFNTEAQDTHGAHSTSVNTSRFIAPYTGIYLCMAAIPFATSNTGKRELFFRTNGTTSHHLAAIDANRSVSHSPALSGLIALSATDYVEACVWQNSGGSLNVTNASRGGQRLDIIKVA